MHSKNHIKMREENIVFFFLLGGYFVITLILFYHQAVQTDGLYPSDAEGYVTFLKEKHHTFSYPVLFFLSDFFSHFMSVEGAFALALSILNALTPVCIKYYMDKYATSDKTCDRWGRVFWVWALMFVGALYIPFLHPYRFSGVGSINAWHNATLLSARSFGIVSFFLFYEIWETYKVSYDKKKNLIFAVVLAVLTLTKPSYTIVFLVVVFLIFLYELFCNRFHYLKRLILISGSFLPTVVILLLQYYLTYETSSDGGIGYFPALVWYQVTDSVILSCLLLMAFPLSVYLMNIKKIKEHKLFNFSILSVLVGFSQAFCLYEKGGRILHGNFFWGYFQAVQIFYIVASIVFFNTFKERKTLYRWVGILLFLAHLICGIVYFGVVYKGGSYA